MFGSVILKTWEDIQMEVNDLGLVATAMFVLVPTVFLIILFVQTEAQSKN